MVTALIWDDAKAFNRKFRKKFGIPPSRVLGIEFSENTSETILKLPANLKNKPYLNFKKWMAEASGTKH